MFTSTTEPQKANIGTHSTSRHPQHQQAPTAPAGTHSTSRHPQHQQAHSKRPECAYWWECSENIVSSGTVNTFKNRLDKCWESNTPVL
ncbi:hypothetical protein FHG87_003260 [Trinorchestia longiramus]|nr:hypothetical protein FHG87_003260 [Trinorchestia longiramus]